MAYKHDYQDDNNYNAENYLNENTCAKDNENNYNRESQYREDGFAKNDYGEPSNEPINYWSVNWLYLQLSFP